MAKSQRFELTYKSTTEILTIAPDGWSSNGQSFQRDDIYHGILQTYSIDTFRFSSKKGGGGQLILDAYEGEDIKAVISVVVKTRNTQTNDYDVSYTGLLNLDTDKFKIDPYNRFVEVSYVESGNIQNFITRDEIEIDIMNPESLDGIVMNFTSEQPIDVLFKPINIHLEAEASGDYNYNFYYAHSIYYKTGNYPLSYYEPLDTEDRINPGYQVDVYPYFNVIIRNQMQSRFSGVTGPALGERSNAIYRNETDSNTKIIFTDIQKKLDTLKWLSHPDYDNPELRSILYLRIMNADDVEQSYSLIDYKVFQWDWVPYFPILIYNLELTFASLIGSQYIMEPGWYMTLGIYYIVDLFTLSAYDFHRLVGSLNVDIYLTEISLSIPESTHSCFTWKNIFKRLFKLITSQEVIFESDFLDTLDPETVATSGWNIRKFPSKPFTLSLRDAFKSCDAIYNIMLSYNKSTDKFYIKPKDQAYNKLLYMFDLGEVKELKINPYRKAYFNEIKGGYDGDGKYEDLNGANEFNLKASYSAEQPVKDTLNIQGAYNADSVPIELSRRKSYLSYASEDTDWDDKIFIVHIENGITVQGANNLTGFGGIDEYYNIAITPRENIIRWANFIKCQYWKEPSFTIRFRSSTKSVNIEYQNQLGEIIHELDNIDQSSFIVDRLFNPQYYEIEGKFDIEKLEMLNTDPHGIIIFTSDNINYAAFIDEVKTKDYEKKAIYKLIANETSAGEQKYYEDGVIAQFEDSEYYQFE